ncbi:MAG: MBL fold metallo-hydrolase [Betaproteobacteria bacterium]|nr:MBL fold metallo-hydrolase [Betaproteobacteria bacterium]
MADVSVTFLGSGDAFGSGGRFQTCILVECPTTRFLMDCGASSLVAMKKQGVSPATIGTILVTHIHGDHFAGIPFFILDAQFSRREAPLIIAGPPGIEARVRDTLEVLFPKSSEIAQRFPITYVELVPSTPSQIGSVCVTAEPVVHFCGAPAYSLRVECAGRTIAYSGDTEWTDALIKVAAGADLFICEAYFFEKKIRFHLDYRSLVKKKASLNCKRMVLTHMSDDMLGRLPQIETEWAEDGETITL